MTQEEQPEWASRFSKRRFLQGRRRLSIDCTSKPPAVLKAFLPEVGTEIKGHMRAHSELLAASGYADRLDDFDVLLRILDGELRLITPTDPAGTAGSGEPSTSARDGQKYYQLTHDYLVPSLREWLSRKQKETRRGRAELLLADRSGIWNARREKRQLPTLTEYLNIVLNTFPRDWSEPETRMLTAPPGGSTARCLAGCLLLAAVLAGGFAVRRYMVESENLANANLLIKQLVVAQIGELPAIVESLEKDPANCSAVSPGGRQSSEARIRAIPCELARGESARA